MDCNYRVLLLKSISEEDEEDQFYKALREHNIPVTLVPILQFRFKNLDFLRVSLLSPDDYSGFLFVSPRCVESVAKCVNNGITEEQKEKWKNLHCFVVGETTARAVHNDLQLPSSGSTSGNFAALLRTIDPNFLEKPLLMPCGNLNKPIPEEKDHKIKKVTTYETTEHPQLRIQLEEFLNDENIHYLIVIFSPSGIDFAKPYLMNLKNHKIQFIALGPTTCKTIEKHNFKVAAVCEKPNPECLISEINKIKGKLSESNV